MVATEYTPPLTALLPIHSSNAYELLPAPFNYNSYIQMLTFQTLWT